MPVSNVSAPKSALITLGSWAIAGAVCTAITFLYLKADTNQENEYIGSLTTRDIQYTASSVSAVSSQLRKQPSLNCSIESLRLLREYVVQYQGLSDLGLYGESGVKCTAMVGALDEEIPDPPASIKVNRTGGKIWAKRKLNNSNVVKASPAYRLGNFLFLLEDLPITAYPPKNSEWEIVHDPGSGKHIGGREGLYQSIEAGELTYRGSSTVTCTDNSDYCVAIHTPWASVLKSRVDVLLLGTISVGLLAFALSSVGHRYEGKRRSVRARALRALSRGTYQSHYQPIIDLRTYRICGCEVLARLEDAHGFLSPGEFIPALSEHGDIQKFTELMFDKAYRGLAELDWPYAEKFKLSFNIFPENLNNQTVGFFQQHPAIHDQRFQICLEVTEDSTISDQLYQRIIEKFSKLGIDVSVDDFGTGYGNLGRLDIGGLKCLKVDKSLISYLTPANVKDSLASFIPLIAARSNLEIIAEGIETQENVEAMLKIGIRYVQGFYFAKPQPAHDMIDAIQAEVELPSRHPIVIPFRQSST